MSPPLLLRAFVNERLTAAAEEIFQVFEKTIAKYEEEASSSKQEIERLRGLLLDFMSNQKTGVTQTSICKDETPSELEPSLSLHQDPDPERRHIKQEDHELWADQQQEDDQQDEDVICAVCGKTLTSPESLNVHLQSHKGSKCCHMCGKHCNSTTALTEHMASHAGVKLHRCHVCGKECSRKGDLKIHMRIHTGEKPFCCSFCCKSFTHSGHLRKHMRSHTGERPHRCGVCGRGFLQSAHLKYHLGTHAHKC
uniref:C2H2-type domain-containing protein n=1 Tax=Amphiprion percula TaxID=161767 RepID=A0A3P8S088_AMPPE